MKAEALDRTLGRNSVYRPVVRQTTAWMTWAVFLREGGSASSTLCVTWTQNLYFAC